MKVLVLEVEGVDVAWKVTVSPSRISQSTVFLFKKKRLEGGARRAAGEEESCLPEASEADVDEKIGAASGDEEDTDWWDCREAGQSQHRVLCMLERR